MNDKPHPADLIRRDPNAERQRKERTEQLYAAVKNASPELYERAVAVASMAQMRFGLTVQAAASIERNCMALVSDALALGCSSGVKQQGEQQ